MKKLIFYSMLYCICVTIMFSFILKAYMFCIVLSIIAAIIFLPWIIKSLIAYWKIRSAIIQIIDDLKRSYSKLSKENLVVIEHVENVLKNYYNQSCIYSNKDLLFYYEVSDKIYSFIELVEIQLLVIKK